LKNQGAIVSHPTPLHPDADLALVLADLRRNVAAWGDEGMVMRVFRASICLMLLSILDTLIDLLADFRAGRLPPVLPAEDESTVATQRETASRQGHAAPRERASVSVRANTPRDAPADAPEPSAAPASRPPAFPLPSPRAPLRHPEPGPCRIVFHPSAVPRPRWRIREQNTQVHSRLICYDFRMFRRMGKRSVTHHLPPLVTHDLAATTTHHLPSTTP
jgi:hypothetical protein